MFKDESQLDDFFGLKSDKDDKTKKESLKEHILKNISNTKIKLIPKVLSKKERYLILTLVFVILGSLISIPFTTFYHYTNAMPDYGSSFSEGFVGQPSHINPLLSQSNDVDRDLVSLIFSGLMKYNGDGTLVPDLAKSYEVSSDGLNYTVYLKEGAKWHDGVAVNADDVVFTIQTAQNSDYGSLQRINWQGVEVEKINDYTLILKLKNKYAQFLNNLTLNILPKHIWQKVQPINFSISDFNLKPIGSGPYKFKKLKKDTAGRVQSYEMESNKNFYDGQPFIDSIEVDFFNNEDEMIDAYNKNSLKNMSFVSAENLKKIKFKKRLNLVELKLPRYFGVFFNENQNGLLAEKNIRLALNYATDKKQLINNVLEGKGIATDSPMIGEVLDIGNDVKKYEYESEKAKQLLETAGWTTTNDQGILIKTTKAKSKKDQSTEKKLTFRLTAPSWPELTNVANALKEQWAKVGIEVIIEVLPAPQLQQVIKERSYEMLLFGEILNIDPDPFTLWHSSQKKDPGLNLALYDNTKADDLLEKARQTLNPLERIKQYEDFQKLVVDDVPAVFLYSSLYIYGQTKDIHGFASKIISMPSNRFSDVAKWYIETRRSFK